MQRRAFLASVTTAAGLGGCLEARRYADERVGDEGGATPDEGTVTTGVPSDRLIEIRDDAFVPRVAEVHTGGLVRWANHDTRDHEVTSAQFHDSATAWEFSSGVLGKTDIVTHRFEEAGVYEYYCSIRGRERTCGAVLVGDVELPGSLPCE
jgi:plastocyanin